jgi:hypothetical protein
MQWNIGRGFAEHERTQAKRQLIKEINPLIALINEPQKSGKLKGYKCEFGLPHIISQKKINSAIFTMDQLKT